MHSRATQYLQSLESNIEQFQNNTLVLRLVLSIAVFVSHFYAVYGLPEPGSRLEFTAGVGMQSMLFFLLVVY